MNNIDRVKTVSPRAFDGWAMSLHPSGPKFSIVCGNCGCSFRERIPTHVSYPRILCPACGTLNVMPLVPVNG